MRRLKTEAERKEYWAVEVGDGVEGCPLLVEASTPAGRWHTGKVRKPGRKRMGR